MAVSLCPWITFPISWQKAALSDLATHTGSVPGFAPGMGVDSLDSAGGNEKNQLPSRKKGPLQASPTIDNQAQRT